MPKKEILTPTDLREELQRRINALIDSGVYANIRQVAIAAEVDYPTLRNAMKANPEEARHQYALYAVGERILKPMSERKKSQKKSS